VFLENMSVVMGSHQCTTVIPPKKRMSFRSSLRVNKEPIKVYPIFKSGQAVRILSGNRKKRKAYLIDWTEEEGKIWWIIDLLKKKRKDKLYELESNLELVSM
jgi:hypothetical protein